MNRIEVRAQVLSCTNCPLHTVGSGPIAFRGPAPAPSKIAVVGEAPGRVEDASRKPFVGPSGVLAEQWLRGVGIEPESVGWVNVVSCYPNRTPTPAEVIACKANLHAQLYVLRPEFLLVFGGVALSSWWPGLRIGDMRGLWWQASVLPGGMGAGSDLEPWAMSTWHPAAVLRNKTKEVQVLQDLEKFRSLRPQPATTCLLCKTEPIAVWDKKGSVGWCTKHDPNPASRIGKGRIKTGKSMRPRGKKAPATTSTPPPKSSLFPETI